MTESLEKNIVNIKNIYDQSYWWAERYDYIESLPIDEIKELKKHLESLGDLSEMWENNRWYCQDIIQKRRHNKLKQIGV